MDDVLISDLATSCVEQFRGFLAIVQQNGKYSSARVTLAADDQAVRFNVWAGNLGVFAHAHGSLDYRLRDSPIAKDLFIKQLEGLQGHFERALRTINDQDDLNEDSDVDELEYERYGLQSSPSSYVSSSIFHSSDLGSMLMAPSLDQPTESAVNSSLLTHISDIENVITRLYRLSIFVRRSTTLTQNPKADVFVMRDEEGHDCSPTFKKYALELMNNRYPDLPSYILHRLSDAVVSRRRRFMWRQRHQKKLDPKGLLHYKTEDHEPKGLMTVARTSPLPRADFTPVSPSREQTVKFSPSARYSNTTASRVTKLDRIPNLDEATVASTVFIGGPTTQIAVPPPPKVPPGFQEFICQYCCMALESRYLDSQRWKSHVFNDLEPLVCLFENCPHSKTLYRFKSSWLSHMQTHHQRLQWSCRSAGHSIEHFESEADFETHLREAHGGTFSEAQVPILKKRSQHTSESPFTSCPFCPGPELPEALSQRSNVLIDHIIEHLQSISLISLPWLDNVDDASSGKTGSVNQSIMTSSSDHIEGTLDFEDISVSSRPNDDPTIPFEPIPSSCDSGWEFLPQAFYAGHERDPVLQPFLRKLYLGFSPQNGTAKGPILPCYAMPFTPERRSFSRTKVLNYIAKGLCPKHCPEQSVAQTLKTYALCGPGGMGKTSIASEFVRCHRDCFDAVLWVHGSSQARLLEDYRDITLKLGLVAEDSMDANDQILTRNVLKRWLINPRKAPKAEKEPTPSKASWLLVFDGVNDADMLDDAWPYDGPGSVLITTRDPLSFSLHSKIVKLGPLDLDEAVQFLLHVTHKEDDPDEVRNAQTIIGRIGGIPLVLSQIAGMIVQQRWSLSDFLVAYGKRESIIDEKSESPQAIHKHSLASVWALESLDHGRVLLNILSMLDPDGIPERILTTHLALARLEGYPRDAAAYSRAKRELLSSSLISEDQEARQVWLHRMCQDVAKMQMDSSTYCDTFFECVRMVSVAWPYELFTWRHGVERWDSCAALFPHVSWLLDLVGSVGDHEPTFDGDYEFARLLTDAGWYNHERGHSDESVRFTDVALSILAPMLEHTFAQIANAPGHMELRREAVETTISEIYHNKGCFATETNKPAEALKYHTLFHDNMVLKIQGEAVRKDMRLAISWNELGNAYMLNRSWNEAKKCFKRSIEDMKLLDGFDQLQLSLPLVNLGLAYWMTDKLTKADSILTAALNDREQVYGPDDSDSFITGRILHALGNVKCEKGLYDESFSFHRRALLQYKSTLGNNHHRTADLCVKVATHHLRLRHFELARALLLQALKIYNEREVFLPERVRALFHHSKALRALGKTGDAERLETICRTLYKQLVPTDLRPFSELRHQDLDNQIVFWSI